MITAAQWKEVEGGLRLFVPIIKLKCDEYEVTLRLESLSQFKNVIAVYVNGKIKGKWVLEDCEERRRFYSPKSKFLYKEKQRASMKKISKKLRQKYELPDPEKKITFYYPYWTSFKALKSHLLKNNTNIELISE